MKKIVVIGAGGKMGFRVSKKLLENKSYDTYFSEISEAGIERLKTLGVDTIARMEDIVPKVDYVLLAIPDILIGKLSKEIIPLMKTGSMVIGLDPAAAYAEVMPIRDDIGYFVVHPHHPYLFNAEKDKDGNLDFFGGVASQDISCALYHGEEHFYAEGEQVARVIFSPVGKAFRLTIKQMGFCEPLLIVFALGSHRGHTEDEMRRLVGERVFDRVSCVDSNSGEYVHLGTTSKGTPVDIFRPVVEADFRICIGNIEYHYFAGYSGGAKAIMPGVSTREAIQANHSRMVQEEAAAGRLSGNPVREDIDEVAEFCSIDFIVNVVLNEKKEIIHCVSGHYIKAHREGCTFLDKMYKVIIPQKADVVLVSAGGFPKDINMYQAQKALDNAKHAVKEGGIIVWVASCKAGLGESVFEKWMMEHEESHEMIEQIERNFQLGGHKAAAIAMVMQKAKIFLVSDLDPNFVKRMHLVPYRDANAAVDDALSEVGSDAKIIVMPYGGSTLPVCIS